LGRVPLGSTVSAPAAAMWVGWGFLRSIGENRFWLVWLINLFNRPQSNRVEMIVKAFA